MISAASISTEDISAVVRTCTFCNIRLICPFQFWPRIRFYLALDSWFLKTPGLLYHSGQARSMNDLLKINMSLDNIDSKLRSM